MFFLSLLLAAKKHRKSRITKSELAEGRDEFDRIFPAFREAQCSRPFEDDAHRAHLKASVVKVFPAVALKMANLHGNLKLVSGARPAAWEAFWRCRVPLDDGTGGP